MRSGGRDAQDVALIPMSGAERSESLEREASEYAEAKFRAGLWSRSEAPALAREEIARTLGERPDEEGHRFLKALDMEGQRVGWVWTGPVPGSRPLDPARWIYQIQIEESVRGRGFGRALLRATEEVLQHAGCPELRLNVFSWNLPAISLYESAGYETVSRYESGREMRKCLAPP